MAAIDVSGDHLTVRFTPWEKVFALRGDLSVPRSAVTGVEVVDDGLAALRGIRAPGLGWFTRAIGTWRRRGHKELVSVRRRQPAVRISLDAQKYTSVLVGVEDPSAPLADLAPA